MYQFFVEPSQIQGNRIVITGSDVNHIKNVLRMKPGEEIAVSNGIDGKEYRCGIEELLEEEIICTLRFIKEDGLELPARVTFFQGLPKADKMELIVQKSTELGAAAIAPVAMIRSVVRLEGKDAAKKTERWQKIAREAVKQCARVSAPEVRLPRKLSAMREELSALDVLIVPWEDARDGSVADCLAPFAQKEDVSVGILIGPEGGIAPEEAEWLTREANAKLVTLGPRILRTETAAIASQTIVMALRGEME